ncbi:DUF99 domain-containing protein [Halobacteriales archaeon QS_8_69_26]|nr:MAG: DUF99 domain-containing protein [Halobacteriales archaeon QS_8_69_26]
MKPGVRALGVAESFDRGDDRSTLAGVVTRASRVVDGFAFSTITVGGTDATEGVVELFERLDREDVRYVVVAGIAPAWFNVVDLHAVHAATDRPTLSVTFEQSEGLERPLREHFDGETLEERLSTYRDQPPRHEVSVDVGTAYVRAVGCDMGEARDIVRAFTPEGGRPEPLRVARLAARAAADLRSGRQG